MSDSLHALPLDQQIGQFFYIGLPGTELDAETRDLIADVKPGGVIIFGRNVAGVQQLRDLLDGVRELVPSPPLFGIDQEGGLVDRLRKIFTPMPAARTIRQHGDLAGARSLGRVTGQVLRMLGFNMNFAPVMEIMTDERDLLSNGLYSRSFGRSPGEVLGYTTVYLRGLQETGITGCLKHFPGIGAGEVDSHEQMPLVQLSRDDLIAQDLAPYIELFPRQDDRVDVSWLAMEDSQTSTSEDRLLAVCLNRLLSVTTLSPRYYEKNSAISTSWLPTIVRWVRLPGTVTSRQRRSGPFLRARI